MFSFQQFVRLYHRLPKRLKIFFKTQTSSKTSESSFYEGSLFQLLTSSQNIFQTEKKHVSSPSWTFNNTTAVFSSHVTLNEDPNNAATHRHAELFPCHVRCLVFFIPSFKMGKTESYSKESSRASVNKTGFPVNESLTMKRIPLPPKNFQRDLFFIFLPTEMAPTAVLDLLVLIEKKRVIPKCRRLIKKWLK